MAWVEHHRPGCKPIDNVDIVLWRIRDSLISIELGHIIKKQENIYKELHTACTINLKAPYIICLLMWKIKISGLGGVVSKINDINDWYSIL